MRHKILLVDDNDDILDLLELYLYTRHDICTASNGFEGLNVAEKERPHCILSDIMMPVMDGITFFNELQKRKTVAGTPVIAVTSFVEQITVKSLLNIGFVKVLFKPVDREDVCAAVAEALAEKPVNTP